VAEFVKLPQGVSQGDVYQFQIYDDLKAAGIEAARRTEEYVEQPKTSQRREGLDR